MTVWKVNDYISSFRKFKVDENPFFFSRILSFIRGNEVVKSDFYEISTGMGSHESYTIQNNSILKFVDPGNNYSEDWYTVKIEFESE